MTEINAYLLLLLNKMDLNCFFVVRNYVSKYSFIYVL